MLVLEKVVKSYMQCTAVNNISLQLKEGKIYGLLGPNGSGKSTMMKMIAGLVKPTSGSITLDGQPVGTETKAHIAYMSTESFFYPYMKISDVAKYYSDFFEDFDVQKFNRLLNELDLNINNKVRDMSTGMIAKLKIAATMSRNAKVIMLDEPLNGIDLIAREKIMSLIMANSVNGNIMIISSHLVDELETFINGAVFIKNGVLQLAGDVEQLKQERGETVVDLYKKIYS